MNRDWLLDTANLHILTVAFKNRAQEKKMTSKASELCFPPSVHSSVACDLSNYRSTSHLILMLLTFQSLKTNLTCTGFHISEAAATVLPRCRGVGCLQPRARPMAPVFSPAAACARSPHSAWWPISCFGDPPTLRAAVLSYACLSCRHCFRIPASWPQRQPDRHSLSISIHYPLS